MVLQQDHDILLMKSLIFCCKRIWTYAYCLLKALKVSGYFVVDSAFEVALPEQIFFKISELIIQLNA